MAAAMTMELTFPFNWAYEGTVDVLYLDPSTGSEMSYGSLQQGRTMVRETFEGHHWLLRESTSRELLMSVVASQPPAGFPQVVVVGSEGSTDPLKAAVWRMGQAPRERLLSVCLLLLKVFQNVVANPGEPKWRSIKASNAAAAAALDVPGVLALMTCAGFEQQLVDGDARLVLPPSRALSSVQDGLAQRAHKQSASRTRRRPLAHSPPHSADAPSLRLTLSPTLDAM